MEMRSDKTGELKKKERDGAGRRKPGFSLLSDSTQKDVNSIVLEANCRVVPTHWGRWLKMQWGASLKMNQKTSCDSLCLQFSSFSVIQLWTSLTCYCRWWWARQTEGRAWSLVENALVSLAATAPLSQMLRCVCPHGYMSCSRMGEAVCQIRLTWQCNNNEVQSLMLSNAILVMVQTDFAFLDELFWVCQIGKCHLKITSLIICHIFSFLLDLTVDILPIY